MNNKFESQSDNFFLSKLSHYWSKIPSLTSIFLLIFLWSIYFYPVVFFNKTLFLGDSFSFDLPNRAFFVESIKKGELPWWNPLILNGVPFLLIASHGIFHPSTLLFFVLPSQIAMTWATILNLLFSGLFMYWFVFLLTGKINSSFFASIIYMFSGFSTVSTNAIIIAQELPLVPLAFLTTYLSFFKRKKIYLFLSSLILSGQFFSGFPLVPYLTALGITIYYLTSTKETLFKSLFSLGLMAFFSFLLCFPFLITQIKASQLSTRPVSNYDYATSSSLHPFSLPTFFLPHFFGIGEIEINKFNTNNKNYIGLLPLILILLMIIQKRKVLNKGLLLITIFGFLLSFGRFNPLYKLALLLPCLANFREPDFFLLWYVFGASYIAGVGLNYLPGLLKKNINKQLLKLFLILFFASCLTFTYLKTASENFWNSLIIFLQKMFFPIRSLEVLTSKTVKIKMLLFLNLSNLIFAFIILLLIFISLNKIKSKKWLINFFLILTFLDLFFLNRSQLFFIDQQEYQRIYTPVKVPEIIKENNVRIHSISHFQAPDWQNFSRIDYLKEKIKKNTDIFYPNQNMLSGVFSVDGFSPLILKSYATYFADNPEGKLTGLTNYDIPNTSRRLDLIGANYIISDKPIIEYQQLHYRLIEENPPYYYLYKNKNARKRAFLIDKKGVEIGKTFILNASANQITVLTEADEESFLILLDNYYPGWQAFVDGVKTEITPFEKTFRQVKLTPGKHKVSFVFKFF